ncbi:MAG: nitroreductase family deazaflavin-dependent oxidoreductase [Chloroflexota bacterium]
MTDRKWRPGDRVDWDRPGNLTTAGGLHAFVLETVGARSGARRHAVLGYLEEPDGWLVIGSKGGAEGNPAWVHNLAAQPDATVTLGHRERIEVRAEPLKGEQLDAAWERIATEASEYVPYRSSTSRAIPVIRLRRR